MDTDSRGQVVKETDAVRRQALVHDSWQAKRGRMKSVCTHCHTSHFVDAFYQQYDDFVVNYNEKFARPGEKIMQALASQGLVTPLQFDDEIEWTWFYLWHHEGRRARHGASMMAPDYAHWHGMYEVAERFYQQLIPQARELADHAQQEGNEQGAQVVRQVIQEILARNTSGSSRHASTRRRAAAVTPRRPPKTWTTTPAASRTIPTRWYPARSHLDADRPPRPGRACTPGSGLDI
jgi:hypothetical protein